MPPKNGLQQGCFSLSSLVDRVERGIEFGLGQLDDFRKETDAGMMRNFSQTTVSRTEFLVHFENAVELRHERPIGGVNCPCAPVEEALDGLR